MSFCPKAAEMGGVHIALFAPFSACLFPGFPIQGEPE